MVTTTTEMIGRVIKKVGDFFFKNKKDIKRDILGMVVGCLLFCFFHKNDCYE